MVAKSRLVHHCRILKVAKAHNGTVDEIFAKLAAVVELAVECQPEDDGLDGFVLRFELVAVDKWFAVLGMAKGEILEESKRILDIFDLSGPALSWALLSVVVFHAWAVATHRWDVLHWHCEGTRRGDKRSRDVGFDDLENLDA
jgi:hypothetical protein